MASETPVIASRIPGVEDVVGDGGMLVTPRDPLELSRAITSMLDDPKKARAMGKNGRQRVERNYDWKVVARQVVDVYKDVLDAAAAF
jgi:glycosyltransferase involved in cell wall biosynthesis